MNKNTKFVVVGGGIAGVTCAETLAFLNPNESICLLTKSRLIKTVTNLVSVSKMLFNFDVEEKDANTLTTVYPNIEVIYDSLIEVCSKEKYIITENKMKIKYEKLCFCMGGQPKLITSEQQQHILGIRDTDSVQYLENQLKKSKRIILVGNGGIATELVYELQNIEVVWIVKDQHISATFLDPGASEFFQKYIQKDASQVSKTIVKRLRYAESNIENESKRSGAALGPDWHTHFNISGSSDTQKNVIIEYASEIAEIFTDSSNNWPISVRLNNGKIIGADFIVSATGVTPNTTILCDLALEKSSEDGGFLVNDRMQTSVEDIYAAGDVCTANWHPLAKHWFQMRLWTQARQMGAYAAQSITASVKNEAILQDFCFEMFAHSTRLFGFKVALLGLFNGQKLDGKYECLMRITPNEEYIKLVVVDGRIQGAILIGDTDMEETVENLILNQLDVTEYGEDLLNPNIDIEDYFD